MKCTTAEFTANAGHWMRAAEEAGEALELVSVDGVVRMRISAPDTRRRIVITDENEAAIMAAADWLRKHGNLENHGHRRRGSACAECKIVNAFLDAAGVNDE
jgi:hypothetical protein